MFLSSSLFPLSPYPTPHSPFTPLSLQTTVGCRNHNIPPGALVLLFTREEGIMHQSSDTKEKLLNRFYFIFMYLYNYIAPTVGSTQWNGLRAPSCYVFDESVSFVLL